MTRTGNRTKSLKRIESGGIPLGAEQRLRDLGAEGSMFTSGLSVKEFALLRQMGPQPHRAGDGRQRHPHRLPVPARALARGDWSPAGAAWATTTRSRAATSTGSPSRRCGRSAPTAGTPTEVCELDVLTQAWRTARRRALDRLREEALQVNADARRRRPAASQRPRSRPAERSSTSSPARRSGFPARPRANLARHHRPVGAGLLAAARGRPGAGRLPGGDRRDVRLGPAATRGCDAGGRRWRNQELERAQRGVPRSPARRCARRSRARCRTPAAPGAVGVTLEHSVHRDKLAVASSLQTAAVPRVEPRAAGPPLLRLRPRRRRTPRLGHHHARRGHRRPAPRRDRRSSPSSRAVRMRPRERIRTRVTRGHSGVRARAAGAEPPGPVHLGPERQRVPARHRGGL